MTQRLIPADFDKAKLREIDDRLASVVADHEVSLILAIESGSRAWGFPSPDSDYDCRFIFVRRLDDYLSPWPKPDYIESALTAELDINGWELSKSLKLILKGNAVVLEWLRSPIVYQAHTQIVDQLRQFAAAHASRDGIARHYLHLGERQRRTYFGDHRAVELKKLFYALRPAAALRWMRLHPSETSPPMDFPTLLNESDPPDNLALLCADLIAQKRVTRELGKAPLPAAVVEFVDSEFAEARESFPEKSRPISAKPSRRRKACSATPYGRPSRTSPG